MIEKTFYQTFLEINIDPAKASKALDDKRLTSSEKKIVESYLLIRNNKNLEAVQVLKGLPTSPLPFVEAFKKLLLGLASNNVSSFLEGEQFLKQSLCDLLKLKSPYFEFMARFNLFIVYLNTKSLVLAKNMIDEMDKIPLETDLQRMRLVRCKLNYFIESNEYERANATLHQIKEQNPDIPESDQIPLLISEFILHIKLENFERCKRVLNEMKKHRKFHLTENFNYMKKLLDHLTDNAPLYVNRDTFSSTPILDYQVKVIMALEEKNESEAKIYWDKLAKISPEVYQSSFNYNGDTCLFSLCLKKHLKPAVNLNSLGTPEGKSQTDAIYEILLNSHSPVLKTDLYQFLWGTLPTEKEDLKKLSRLITNIRAEKGVEVCSRKGTYFIEKMSKKKVG